jgi:RNA polymerase sigma-70 factor (ECF subfamily)
MFQKPKLKEYAVVVKGKRDTVRQPDHGLQRALNGDREALGHRFASQTPQLYRAALRILGRSQDAEEALQDGFLSAIRHLGEFECRSGFSTWLTRIVINVALIRLRKGRRAVLTSFDPRPDRDGVDLAVTVTDPRPNPEEIYQRKERFQMFERNLRKLPPRYQSILWMRDVQGMSTREAAETLGIKSTTVKSQLHRARLRLGVGSCIANAGHRTLQQAGMIAAQSDIGLSQD